MSLNNKSELRVVAKVVCRELRKYSTEAERVFWDKVRNKQFLGKKFYRQYPIFHDLTGKENFFVADFFCYTDKLIVELDGNYHQYRLKEDDDRTKILNYLELQVIRFTNDEIMNNLEGVLKTLIEYLA
jgi:very-short-patch-repair endonuclease